jgi:hypothetical protein
LIHVDPLLNGMGRLGFVFIWVIKEDSVILVEDRVLVRVEDIQFAECLILQSNIACRGTSTMTIFIAIIPQEQPMCMVDKSCASQLSRREQNASNDVRCLEKVVGQYEV